MNKGLKYALASICLVCLVLPSTSWPCSSFAFLNRGHLIFGTNYDNDFWPGLLFINPRGLKKSSWEPGTTGALAEWTSRYGSVTIACAGYQLPWAGMNEVGLVFSTMALAKTQVPAPDERPAMAGTFWLQYALDTCGTVGELLATLDRIRVTDTEDHYLVADASGDCAALEFLLGKPVVHRGASLRIRALTNMVYAQCLAAWDTKTSPSSSRYHSINRFSRLAERLDNRREESPQAAVESAYDMLDGVASTENTRWSLVFDTGNKIFHFKTFRNRRLRSIDLKAIDFSCPQKVRMFDPHADLVGDITAAFKAYSHEDVLNHMLKALKYFRPGIEEELIRRILALFESFACPPGSPKGDVRR